LPVFNKVDIDIIQRKVIEAFNYSLLLYQISIMKIIDQFAEYLFLKKRDKNAPKDIYMKMMHGMNRISIFVFLIALIIILVKTVIIPYFK